MKLYKFETYYDYGMGVAVVAANNLTEAKEVLKTDPDPLPDGAQWGEGKELSQVMAGGVPRIILSTGYTE